MKMWDPARARRAGLEVEASEVRKGRSEIWEVEESRGGTDGVGES